MEKNLIEEYLYPIKDSETMRDYLELEEIHEERDGKYICLFHDDHNPSASIDNKTGKFHCFTCGKSWDILDVCGQIHGTTDMIEQLKIVYKKLGRTLVIGSDKQLSKEGKLTSFIQGFKDDSEEGLFRYQRHHYYRDEEGNVKGVRVILYNTNPNWEKDGQKKKVGKIFNVGTHEKGYYEIYSPRKRDEKVWELPYNLKKVIDSKTIIITEGEKDCDRVTKETKLTTTTFLSHNTRDKETWEKRKEYFKGKDIIFIGDTGESGDKYKDLCFEQLKPVINSFKVVNLKNIKLLGDNQDVSDWLDNGHTKEELFKCIKWSKELLGVEKEIEGIHQDNNEIFLLFKDKKRKSFDDKLSLGFIYQEGNKYYEVTKDGVEEVIKPPLVRFKLVNFIILEGKRETNLDTNKRKLILKVKTELGEIKNLEGDFDEVFLDIKSFKRFITSDCSTMIEKTNMLTSLKDYILNYMIDTDIVCYRRTGLRKINNEWKLVTNCGTLDKDGIFNTNLKGDNDIHNIDYQDIKPLTINDNIQDSLNRLINFNRIPVSMNVIGSTVSQMLNGIVRQNNKEFLPVPWFVGESHSGKSKSLKISMLLTGNTGRSISMTGTSKFALQYLIQNTYLPMWVDEVKPSVNKRQEMILSEILRDITGDGIGAKGTKDQECKKYEMNSSLILSGEDTMNETAVGNRGNIITFSRLFHTEETLENVEFLCNTDEGQEFLKRLSLNLYLYILNHFDIEILESEYKSIKVKYKELLKEIKEERIKSTITYTIMGIEIFHKTIKSIGCDFKKEEYIKELVEQFKETIIEDDINKSEYEKILEEFSYLMKRPIGSGYSLRNDTQYKVQGNNIVGFKIKDCWDQLVKYYKDCKTENIPLSEKTFRKTLKNSKYYDSYGTVRFKEGEKTKIYKCFKLKRDELEKLGFEFEDEEISSDNKIIPMFRPVEEGNPF